VLAHPFRSGSLGLRRRRLTACRFNRGLASFGKIARVRTGRVPPEQRLPTPESQMDMQATWAMKTITATTTLANDESLPEFAQIACLEDFFVNVRAMIEFLIRTPNRPSTKGFPRSISCRRECRNRMMRSLDSMTSGGLSPTRRLCISARSASVTTSRTRTPSTRRRPR
jgi:hypothetical protein